MEGTAFGRYRLIELLGRGGMGEVWRAFDTGTNRQVAIKVLPAHLAQDSEFEARFRREADLVAGLSNPHIVPIHDYGEIDGRLFVSMRLIEGHDLAAELARGALQPERAVQIIEHIAHALHTAHRAGLVHRDVKPSNILIDDDDYAYLIDFGIARAINDTGMTGTGNTIGTWAYMAPERFRGNDIDARVDVYALACVLCECFTGSTPYPGTSFEKIAVGHMFEPPPAPSRVRAGLPTTFDEVIARGMAKDPGQRYPSARELATAARAATITEHAALEIDAPSASAPERVRGIQPEPIPPLVTPMAETSAAGYAAPVTSEPDPRATLLSDWSQEVSEKRPADDYPTRQEPTATAPTRHRTGPLTDTDAQTVRLSSTRWSRKNKAYIGLAVFTVVIIAAISIAAFWDSSPTQIAQAPEDLARLRAAIPIEYSCDSINLTTEFHDPDGILAAQFCSLAKPEPVKSVTFYLYRNPQSLEDSLAGFADADEVTSRMCPGRQSKISDWYSSPSSDATGKVLCYLGSDRPMIIWTVDSELLRARAIAAPNVTIEQLYAWWSANNAVVE